jgi:glycosyltransferase involved in cell wall biosynthesis
MLQQAKSMGQDIQRRVQCLGWTAADAKFWETLNRERHRIAFLAPPLETIPNPSGNAIYCLVERLVERLGAGTMAMAVGPDSEAAKETPIRDRLLYYHHSLKPSLVFRLLPWRVKKYLFGAGAPELRKYGRSAGAVLRAMQMQAVVVEDVPILVSALASTSGPNVKQVLHQHINAPTGMPSHHWRKVCRCLQGIVFVAQKTQQEAVQCHGGFGVPSRVIYNGVDLSHYSPVKWTSPALGLREQLGIAPDCSVLLFVGRLLPFKGVAESAEAFNRASVTKSRMLIIGDPEIRLYRDDAYLQRLKTAAENSAGRIHLVGKVAQTELPKWYAASDAVIVPSLGAEGLPKIITEALAMGKPVLASDRGGAWELLREGQNGWLIRDPSDLESTARLIKQVLSDRAVLLNLSPGILNRDRPFMSEERMVKEFADTLADWCAGDNTVR